MFLIRSEHVCAQTHRNLITIKPQLKRGFTIKISTILEGSLVNSENNKLRIHNARTIKTKKTPFKQSTWNHLFKTLEENFKINKWLFRRKYECQSLSLSLSLTHTHTHTKKATGRACQNHLISFLAHLIYLIISHLLNLKEDTNWNSNWLKWNKFTNKP